MRNAAMFMLLIALSIAIRASAADPSDTTKAGPAPKSAQPMNMKEPMAGEMKKDGMMKEDVSKAEKKWSKDMDEKMKREKMK